VRVEPDLLDGRNEGIEEGGAEIDESVGGDEGGGHRRLVLRPVILAEGVESEEREHSTRNPLPDSHFHFRKLEIPIPHTDTRRKLNLSTIIDIENKIARPLRTRNVFYLFNPGRRIQRFPSTLSQLSLRFHRNASGLEF